MKSLQQHIAEKLIISKGTKIFKDIPQGYEERCVPENPRELRKLLCDIYNDFGEGTRKDTINLNWIDVSHLDTLRYNSDSNGGVFHDLEFKYIDVSGWVVDNIRDMDGLFLNCEELRSVGNLKNWDVRNVKYMDNMFNGCGKLFFIGDISQWDVRNVIETVAMFMYCRKLKNIGNLKNWKTDSLKMDDAMFWGCPAETTCNFQFFKKIN